MTLSVARYQKKATRPEDNIPERSLTDLAMRIGGAGACCEAASIRRKDSANSDRGPTGSRADRRRIGRPAAVWASSGWGRCTRAGCFERIATERWKDRWKNTFADRQRRMTIASRADPDWTTGG